MIMKKMYRFSLVAIAMVLIVSSLALGYTEAYAATKKTPAKPKITVKVSDNEVTVTINKTKNAAGYEIFVKNSDASAYEKTASDVITNPKALFKTEAEDGDYVYYVEETNEFVVLSLDGFIRTYFLPSSGKKYFDRQ